MTYRSLASTLLAGVLLLACAACAVDNPNEANMTVTPSGLKYTDEMVGTGEEAQKGDTVSVHYTGRLKNGTKFDSSHDTGKPIVFELGARKVIKGWDEGLTGMKVGGKRKLVIPSDLAYGDKGFGNVIPPKAELHFDVELVKVVPAKGRPRATPKESPNEEKPKEPEKDTPKDQKPSDAPKEKPKE